MALPRFIMDAIVYPFSERGKSGIETELVDPDACADAQEGEERPTAWLMGAGCPNAAKPQVWNERGQPCFAPEPASKIFLRGMQKYAPHPPLPPRTRPYGRVHGQTGRVLGKTGHGK